MIFWLFSYFVFFLSPSTCSLWKAVMLAFLPQWSARGQYRVLMPLLLCLLMLCYFGDWQYTAYNVVQGVLSCGAAEFIRCRHVLRRVPKVSV